MIDAVILDYGHTIVDFALDERAMLAAFEQVRELLLDYASGALPSAPELRDALSHGLGKRIEESYLRRELQELDIIEVFRQNLGGLDLRVPPDLLHRIVALEHRAQSAETWLPPENADALRRMRAEGFRLGLVSNITLLGSLVREDLARLGISDLFDTIILSSEMGVRKPHPDIYAAALDGLGLPAARALFVGDRLREDIGGPREAGMAAVLTHQFRQEIPTPDTPRPAAVIDLLADLPAVACRLRAAAVP